MTRAEAGSDRSSGALARTDDRAYDLRQRLNRAVRWLREAEDIARVEMPAWPTADRIRSIYEQVTEDVLNGRESVPPMRQRLTEAEAERDWYRLRWALAHGCPVEAAQRAYERDHDFRASMEAEVVRAALDEEPK